MAAKQGSSPKVKNAGKKRRIVTDPKPINRRGGGKPQPQLITSWKRVQGTQNRVFTLSKELLEACLGEEIRLDVELHLKFLCGLTTEPFLDEEPLLRHPELEQPTDNDRADELMLRQLQVAFFNACMMTPDSKFVAHDDGRQVIRGRTHRFFAILLEHKQQQEEQERQRRVANRRNRNPKAIPNGVAQQLQATGHATMVDRQRQNNHQAVATMAKASGR